MISPTGSGLSRSRVAQGIAALGFLCESQVAFGLGEVQFESSTFLRTSDRRGDISSTIEFGLQKDFATKKFEGKFDISAWTFAEDPTFLTAESKNFYVATREGSIGRHQVSLGRRTYSWSQSDSFWNQGMWNPRFTWDPTHPQPVGLTGLFYSYSAPTWGVRAMASPIGVPERGFPIRSENGKLNTPSAFLYPLPRKVSVLTQVADIHYDLQLPSPKELVMNAGGAVSFWYGEPSGFWAQTSYGYLPNNQVDIPVDAKLSTGDLVLDAVLRPRVFHHHMLTTELGYRGSDWEIWGSFSRETPEKYARNPDYIYAPMGPVAILSTGFGFQFFSDFKMHGGFLVVNEDKVNFQSDVVDLELPSRFSYTHAVKWGLGWSPSGPVESAIDFTYDTDTQSALWSADFNILPSWKRGKNATNRWTIRVGADLFVSSTGKGIIGQYVGNDRIRGGVSYAF